MPIVPSPHCVSTLCSVTRLKPVDVDHEQNSTNCSCRGAHSTCGTHTTNVAQLCFIESVKPGNGDLAAGAISIDGGSGDLAGELPRGGQARAGAAGSASEPML